MEGFFYKQGSLSVNVVRLDKTKILRTSTSKLETYIFFPYPNILVYKVYLLLSTLGSLINICILVWQGLVDVLLILHEIYQTGLPVIAGSQSQSLKEEDE